MDKKRLLDTCRFIAPLFGIAAYAIVHAFNGAVGGTVFYLLCMLAFLGYQREREDTIGDLKATIMCQHGLFVFEFTVFILQIAGLVVSDETKEFFPYLVAAGASTVIIWTPYFVFKLLGDNRSTED